MNPDWPALLSEWDWEPSVILGVLLISGAYLWLSGAIPSKFNRGPRSSARQIGWFLGGMAVILLALISPLDHWGDEYLFSAHMFQHLLLMLAVPPMLILGFPGWITQRVASIPQLKKAGRFLASALVAFIIFNATYILWHIPAFYEAALENEGLHIAEHITFLAAGVINWWPIFSTSEDFPPITPGFQILFLFLEGIPSTILTAVIVFSGNLLYPFYETAPRVFGISPADDQQIAGLAMGSVSMLFYLMILTFVFFRWIKMEEKNQNVGAKSM